MLLTRRELLHFGVAMALPGALTSGRMLTRAIPRTGEQVPVIGLGTWQTFDAPPSPALGEVLEAFFAAGGSVIDSSPMYGRAEETVGALLGPARDKAFVATKVWIQGQERGEEQMRDSFRKLRVDRVDLMQVHNLLDWRTHLPTLRALKQEGRIRYLGVTHYLRSSFDELERILRTEAVDFVQLPYSVAVRDAEARLLPAARDTGTAVLVMRPFESGELFSRVRGKPLPDFASELGCTSWGQLFLKFILGHPAVTCPIPATSKKRHLEDNVRAGTGPLPGEALRRRIVEHLGL